MDFGSFWSDPQPMAGWARHLKEIARLNKPIRPEFQDPQLPMERNTGGLEDRIPNADELPTPVEEVGLAAPIQDLSATDAVHRETPSTVDPIHYQPSEEPDTRLAVDDLCPPICPESYWPQPASAPGMFPGRDEIEDAVHRVKYPENYDLSKQW